MFLVDLSLEDLRAGIRVCLASGPSGIISKIIWNSLHDPILKITWDDGTTSSVFWSWEVEAKTILVAKENETT